jgi:hypothetical protein
MGFEIACQQFIYGKFVALEKAKFNVIAQSVELSSDDINSIYDSFNAYRPIRSSYKEYGGAYIISPLDENRIVLANFERSKEKEKGRTHFLQEHYIVIEKGKLLKQSIKLWAWLAAFPEADAFEAMTSLPSITTLSKLRMSSQLTSAINRLGNKGEEDRDGFRDLILNTLYQLLNNRNLMVKLPANGVDVSVWVTALAALLPNSLLANMKIFIGAEPPKAIDFDLVITESRTQECGLFIRTSSRQWHEIELIPIEKIQEASYVRLAWHCLDKSDTELIQELVELVSNSEGINYTLGISDSLDMFMWLKTMPTIGIKILRRELHSDTQMPVSDIVWLWRNVNEVFTQTDVENVLPLLLHNRLDKWGKEDFVSLRDVLLRFPEIVSVIHLDESSVMAFIHKWSKNVTVFNKQESYFIALQLNRITKEAPEATIKSLIVLIQKSDCSEIPNYILKIQNNLPDNVQLSTNNYWHVSEVLLQHSSQHLQSDAYLSILKNICLGDLSKPVLEVLGYFQENNFDDHQIYKVNSIQTKIHGHESLLSLFFTIILKHQLNNSISLFAYLMLGYQSMFTNFYLELNKELLDIYFENQIDTQNYRALGSFIYVIRKVGYSNVVNDFLAELLVRNNALFVETIYVMQAKYLATRADLNFTLNCLSSLNLKRQLELFTIYTNATSAFSLSGDQVESVLGVLVSMDSKEFESGEPIGNRKQADFMAYCMENGLHSIYHKLLEHQIRSFLKRKELVSVERKLGELKTFLRKNFRNKYERAKSKVNFATAKAYLENLSLKENEDYLRWLLEKPINEKYTIKKIKKPSLSVTTKLLSKNTDWFFLDYQFRYYLFEAVFHRLKD